MNSIVDWIIGVIGTLMLWGATDVGRKEDSKVKFLSLNYWLQFILLVLGVYLVIIGFKFLK